MFWFGFHPFHIVTPSPWPIIGSLSSMSLALNFFLWVSKSTSLEVLLLSMVSVSLVLFQWWRDVIRESTFMGCHSKEVMNGLYLGVIMFILSEVMFFFSFFFSFFFLSLSPDVELGGEWPPVGIQPLSLMEVPLLNTLLLLSSGVSITWCHHSLMESNKSSSLLSGFITIFLGSIFSYFQYEEYSESAFTMADSVYGSLFFIMTGFHGIHVIVGALMIFISIIRILINHFSNGHHLGFEAAAWYWHFVDVVWLFLFISVYWWGS
nr:cytochrome c oxidase subunit 3 [Pessoaiella absita]